ncbi:hypothetical protein AYI69_g6643 [Smittium culicis]|uniref:Uncharacterized protein n=1 Tax=Smittium culicis TaxID=133412 RepID=A0A1R1XXH0_9FUNG|nr:hypothetical protein AYI69_g6643 [Smittium culicis]
MEQIAETQAPASQDQVKVLTELVQQLLREKERNQEPEDPYFTTRIPVTDLKAYPELTEVLPSIEEDLLHSPLTEEKRKIAIHSCPRTSSMNYNPPPLNDSSSSAVKKADTALYGIQVALAQAKRSIDYFVHRRIQEKPGLDTSEDPEVMFSSTMRALLSDVTGTVTQARLDNLHKELELPGKPTQLVEPDAKPLMDQEALDALISKKQAAKRQRIQPFRKLQKSSNNKNSIISNSITAQSTNAVTTAEATSNHKTSDRQSNFPGRGSPVGGRLSMFISAWSRLTDSRMVRNIVERGFRIPFKSPHSPTPISKGARRAPFEMGGTWRWPFGPTPSESLSNTTADVTPSSVQEKVGPGGQQTEGSRLLQPAVHDPEKERRPQTSLGPPQAQPICREAELQDGDSIIHLPHGPQKRLFEVSRTPGCIHAYPVRCPAIRAITELVGFHQGSSPSFKMGQAPRNANLSIFGRPTNHERIQGCVCENHTQDILQAPGAWIQDPRREIVYIPIPIYHTSGDGNKHTGYDTEGSENQDPRSSTRGQQTSERWPDDIEMSGELYWESPSNVDRSPTWPSNAPTTPGTQELLSVDIEIMDLDSETDEPIHPEPIKLEEIAEIMERSIVLGREPGIGDLHGLQRFSVGDCGRPSHILRIMDTIRGEDAHKRQGTDDDLLCTQAQECDRTRGFILLGKHNRTLVQKEIRGNYFPRTAQNNRENLFTLSEDQYPTISDLCSIKLIRVQMDGAQQPLCMPALESDSANRAEGAQGTNNDDFSYANMEIGHMVPRSDIPL